jgi:hypothetical protein
VTHVATRRRRETADLIIRRRRSNDDEGLSQLHGEPPSLWLARILPVFPLERRHLMKLLRALFAPHGPRNCRRSGCEDRFRQGVRFLCRQDVFDQHRHDLGQRSFAAPRPLWRIR